MSYLVHPKYHTSISMKVQNYQSRLFYVFTGHFLLECHLQEKFESSLHIQGCADKFRGTSTSSRSIRSSSRLNFIKLHSKRTQSITQSCQMRSVFVNKCEHSLNTQIQSTTIFWSPCSLVRKIRFPKLVTPMLWYSLLCVLGNLPCGYPGPHFSSRQYPPPPSPLEQQQENSATSTF